jgi:hypothetical protein
MSFFEDVNLTDAALVAQSLHGKGLLTEMIDEHIRNGASQRFDALNEAFSHPDRVKLLYGGTCQSGMSWSAEYQLCQNETDADKTHCEDCIETIQNDELAAAEMGYFDEERMINEQYKAAARPF